MATAKLVELAYASETTPGTPPADAAAWVSDGVRIRVIPGVDASGIRPDALKDDRAQTNYLDKNDNVEGLRNGSFTFQVYLTGSGATTTAGDQISATDLMNMLENAMGGMDRSNSTACAAAGTHTTTQIEVDADTNFAVGGHVIWEHPTTGEGYLRRLTGNTSGTIWTLDEDLPQAADDGDVIHGVGTAFVDPDVMADSNSSGRQFSWWMRLSGSNDEIYVLKGCKLQLTEVSLQRGELPTLTFELHYASIVLPSESPPQPSWVDDPSGEAPVALGVDTDVFLQDYGSTTRNNACTAEVSFSPGLPIVRDEVVNEPQDGMEGTCKYYVSDPEPTCQLKIRPFSTDFFTDWSGGTKKVFRYSKVISSAGQMFGVAMPRAEVQESPGRGEHGEKSSVDFTLRAHRDTDTIGTTDLARSPIYICVG